MKKVLFIGLAIASITTISCRKDWTCECTATANGSTSTQSSTISNATEEEAEAECNESYSVGDSLSYNCELKK